MNVVTLVGGLASEVELHELEDGRRVANFLLAVERPGAGGKADLIRVATWNAQADLCGRLLVRGGRVGIDGRLRSRVWRESGGTRRRSVEVVANRVELLPPESVKSSQEVSLERVAAA